MSLLVFSGVRVARSIVFYVVCCRSLIVFYHLAVVLSVLLQFIVSDSRFGIFKLFLFKTFCKNQLSETIIIFVPTVL